MVAVGGGGARGRGAGGEHDQRIADQSGVQVYDSVSHSEGDRSATPAVVMREESDALPQDRREEGNGSLEHPGTSPKIPSMPSSVEVRPVGVKGKGVFATR